MVDVAGILSFVAEVCEEEAKLLGLNPGRVVAVCIDVVRKLMKKYESMKSEDPTTSAIANVVYGIVIGRSLWENIEDLSMCLGDFAENVCWGE